VFLPGPGVIPKGGTFLGLVSRLTAVVTLLFLLLHTFLSPFSLFFLLEVRSEK
jgi:hypothetical protein